jgi:hypothetical protein
METAVLMEGAVKRYKNVLSGYKKVFARIVN